MGHLVFCRDFFQIIVVFLTNLIYLGPLVYVYIFYLVILQPLAFLVGRLFYETNYFVNVFFFIKFVCQISQQWRCPAWFSLSALFSLGSIYLSMMNLNILRFSFSSIFCSALASLTIPFNSFTSFFRCCCCFGLPVRLEGPVPPLSVQKFVQLFLQLPQLQHSCYVQTLF